MKTKWILSSLIGAGAICMAVLILMGFEKSSYKSLEVENLTIKSPDGRGVIELGFYAGHPLIQMIGENSEVMFELAGGEHPTLELKGKSSLTVKSGDQAGIFLKNELDKTVGSWTVLNDGGAGFGLADQSGAAAAIIRGGVSPSIAFFSSHNEPLAALGVMQKVPHLLISGPQGNEGILIHGGKPNSMVVVDEVGKVKVLISKHGVFQGKEQSNPPFKKNDNKVFSLEDQHRLFPEENTVR